MGRKLIPKAIPHGSEQEEQIFMWRMTRKERAQEGIGMEVHLSMSGFFYGYFKGNSM